MREGWEVHCSVCAVIKTSISTSGFVEYAAGVSSEAHDRMKVI